MEEAFHPYDDETIQIGHMWLIFSDFFSLIQGFVIELYTLWRNAWRQKIAKVLTEEYIQSVPVLRIQTDLDQIRIRPLRTDRIWIHLIKMYLVVPKV
jgi:hypothetical protein